MFKVVFWAFFEISLLVTLEPQVGHTKFPDFYPSFEIIIHSCGKVYCLGPQAEKETKHKMAYVCRLNYFSYSCGPSVGVLLFTTVEDTSAINFRIQQHCLNTAPGQEVGVMF